MTLLSTLLRIKRLREAGGVIRCHTLSQINLGSYTVGAHSWNVVVLLLALHPNPSPELMKACLFHDVAERWLGDIPAPALWRDPLLGEVHGRLEREIMKNLGAETNLSPEEKLWLEHLDRLDFFLWCEDQILLGNRNMEPVRDGVLARFKNLGAAVPAPIREVVLGVDGFYRQTTGWPESPADP